MVGLKGGAKAPMQIAQPISISTPGLDVAKGQMDSLAAKLSAFSSSMFKMSATNAKIEASENAVKDMHKYKNDTHEIMADVSLSDEDKNNKLKELSDKHEYDGWGQAYTNAYKTSFDAAYANTVTNEAGTIADGLTAKAQGSSSAFLNSWTGYSKGIVEAAPTEALASVAKLTLDRQGSSKYKALATAEFSKRYAMEKQSSKDVLEFLHEEYVTAYTNHDKAGMTAAKKQYTEALSSSVKSGFMSLNAGRVQFKIAEDDATVGRIYADFSKSTNMGNSIKEAFNSKEFQQLPKKKRDDLMSSMLSDVKAKEERRSSARKEAEYWEAEAQEKAFFDTQKLILTDKMTLGEILRMENKQEISLVQSASLKTMLADGGRKESDGRQLTSYYTNSYLATEATEEQIYSDTMLSYKDRIKLLKDRRKLLNTTYKWTISQNGKEARDRVRREFGMVEGTFMAKMDFNNKNGIAFNKMFTSLFNKVSELPVSEQEAAAIRVADELILEYRTAKIDASNKSLDAVEAKRLQEAQKKKDNYDSSIWYQYDKLMGNKERNVEWYLNKGNK